MIFTASYFEKQYHHGRLICGSQSAPSGFEDLEKWAPVVPSWQMVTSWKNAINRHRLKKTSDAALAEDWEIYRREYWRQLDKNKSELCKHIEEIEGDLTILCWEKSDATYPQCHRRIFGEFVKTHYLELWGGDDVWYKSEAFDNSKYLPAMHLLVAQLAQHKIDAGFAEDQEGFFTLFVDGEELDGMFTAPALLNILSNLLKPVQPLPWFTYYKIEKFHPKYKKL